MVNSSKMGGGSGNLGGIEAELLLKKALILDCIVRLFFFFFFLASIF